MNVKCIRLKKQMSALFLSALFLFLTLPVFAQQTEADDYGPGMTTLIRIQTEDPLALYKTLEEKGYDVDDETITDTTIDLYVTQSELDTLRMEGYDIIMEEEGRPLYDILLERGEQTDGTKGYPDFAAVLQTMKDTVAQYPKIAKLYNITQTYQMPQTHKQNDHYAIKISDHVDKEENEPAILIVSAHHSNEIVTPLIALHAMKEFTEGYATNHEMKKIVDENEIWIVPVWNVDGYHHVFETNNHWRKNMRGNNGTKNCQIGVDLNRNYPQGWHAKESGSTNPSNNTHKGESPASEPETQTMMTWSRDQRFAKILDFHSSGREVVNGYRTLKHPFTKWMNKEAELLSQKCGYRGQQRPPSSNGEHYQWQYGQMGAWSYLVETALEHQPPYKDGKAEVKKVFPGIVHAINRPITISGNVTNATTGAPVVADIEMLNVKFKQKETNQSEKYFGRYHIFAPKGTYEVKFSAKGYHPKTETVTIAKHDDSVVLDIKLSPTSSNGPAPPEGLVATPKNNKICLTWRDNPETDIDHYSVKRCTKKGGPHKAIAAPHASQFTDADVTAGTTYYYVVTAIDTQGNESSNSHEVSAKPDGNHPTVEIYDGFETYGWNGGKGWKGAWTKKGDIKKIKKRPYKGKRYARFRNKTGRLQRTVDLSGVSNPHLIFVARLKEFEAKDQFLVKVSSDGGKSFTTVKELGHAESDNTYHEYRIDLAPHSPGKDFKIKFVGKMDQVKDFVYLDEISIVSGP